MYRSNLINKNFVSFFIIQVLNNFMFVLCFEIKLFSCLYHFISCMYYI